MPEAEGTCERWQTTSSFGSYPSITRLTGLGPKVPKCELHRSTSTALVIGSVLCYTYPVLQSTASVAELKQPFSRDNPAKEVYQSMHEAVDAEQLTGSHSNPDPPERHL